MTQTDARPLPGIMYGITHEEDGSLRIREPKLLKVGIGMPKGRALFAWLTREDGVNSWRLTRGYKKDDMATLKFATRAECESAYGKALANAPICPYPRKLSFFTFTRPVVTDAGEEFMPDFEAIESHGPVPTEIDVVFVDDDPFTGQYQMWSSSELKCWGDGLNALRVFTMFPAGSTPPGEKWIPIENGCWLRGCPFARGENGKPSACKPGGDLKFQLANNIRVGGTSYFHTTGFRSISQIFSSLSRIKMLTNGRLRGLPLKMTLRPYKVKPEGGKPATQYGVALELRSEDMAALRKLLMQNLWESPAIATPVRMIEGPEEVIAAGSMTAEFYPESTERDDDEEEEATEPVKASPPIATATAAKTEALKEKLTAVRDAIAQTPATDKGPVAAPEQEPKDMF
jgi:Recombination directionality factor-like